jgi:hypothetical protein
MKQIMSELVSQVSEAIHQNEAFSSEWEVDVLEQNRVITLDGTVPSAESKTKAEEIAKNQSGVKGVINNLDIKPSEDESIQKLDVEDVEDKAELPPSKHILFGP